MNLTSLLIIFLVLVLIFSSLFYRMSHSFKNQSEEKNRLARALQLVNELSIDIASIMDLDRLLPNAMEAFVKAGEVSKGSLMLVNDELGVLEIYAAVGLSDFRRKTSRPKIGEGIAGLVAKNGKAILVADVSQDKTYYKDFEEDLKLGRPKESILCLPLKFKERVLGVVSLESKASGQPFEKRDETVLSILANAVAVAITNAKLYELAITDGMTKLTIHRYFQVRLEQELVRARRYNLPLSLMMIDIDYFKKFNDTYGHPEGDRVLIQVAKLMKECTRETDVCARYGGEEFAVVVPDTNDADAYFVAERFRKRVESTPILIEEQKVFIAVSIGLTTFRGEKGIRKEELIDRADKALYYAKRNGRNRVVQWEQIPAFPEDSSQAL